VFCNDENNSVIRSAMDALRNSKKISHSLFIHIFQFDFGSTSYKKKIWGKKFTSLKLLKKGAGSGVGYGSGYSDVRIRDPDIQMYGSGIRIRTNTGYNPISADLRGARGGAGNDEILPQHWMIRCLGLKQKPSNTILQSN
jgi:hypothetical protein